MNSLLEVRDLRVVYDSVRGDGSPVAAVDGVSFDVEQGVTLGLVGESGSGKSTIGRAILGLTPATSGHIRFNGSDITPADKRARRALSRELQVVFQDPFGSLNPTRTIGDTIAEPIAVHERLSRSAARVRVRAMLERVGLPPDADRQYPKQFSGGQRQRIAIARALVMSPRLVICDEPVSSLDLSIQAQVLNLLRDLQDEYGLSYLFIAHDLSIVHYLSHRILVMYKGRIVEEGAATDVAGNPAHPYTRALLAAAPVADPQRQLSRRIGQTQQSALAGVEPLDGACSFRPRCPYAVDACKVAPMLEQSKTGTLAACHRRDELDPLPAELRLSSLSAAG
jgi:oligopeptide/dipeptide ABC transporter ATP-binding protein